MKQTILYVYSKIMKKLRGAAVHHSSVDKTSKTESGTEFINSEMEKYSFCGYNCQIINCSIGKFVSIADDVKIGGARHPIEWVSTSPVFYYGRDSVKKKFSEFKREKDRRTYIGNDVWIGAGSIIIQGVKVGNGAVIGAGSVVTHDVGDYEIVAGNPARVIRMRFPEDTVKRLLESKWWDLPDDRLQSLAPYIQDPTAFLNELEKRK